MAPPEEPSKAVSSNDFFESIGQQAEQVQQSEAEAQTDGDDTSRVVEEIESLCMECHENAGRPPVPLAGLLVLTCHRRARHGSS